MLELPGEILSKQVTLGFCVWKETGSIVMSGLEGSETSGREVRYQS